MNSHSPEEIKSVIESHEQWNDCIIQFLKSNKGIRDKFNDHVREWKKLFPLPKSAYDDLKEGFDFSRNSNPVTDTVIGLAVPEKPPIPHTFFFKNNAPINVPATLPTSLDGERFRKNVQFVSKEGLVDFLKPVSVKKEKPKKKVVKAKVKRKKKASNGKKK